MVAGGRSQQRHGDARRRACRGGSEDAASAAARAGQDRAAALGRTEAVTAPGGGKRVVHAF